MELFDKYLSKIAINKFLVVLSVFAMIFLPVIWSVGYSYRLYGEHPWPGVAIYAHIAVVLLFLVFIRSFKYMLESDLIYFYLFLFYVLLTVVHCFLFFVFSSKEYSQDAFLQALIAIVYFFSYFIVGYYLFQFKWSLFFILLIFLFFIGVSVFEVNLSSTIPVSLYVIYGDYSTVVVNYQLVSLAILFLALLVLQSNIYFKPFILILILLMVFLTGGRSEFLGSIITLLFLFLLVSFVTIIKRFSLKRTYFVFIILLVAIVLLFFYFALVSKSDFLNNRNFQVVNLEEVSSWKAREEIEKVNIKNIKSNPFFGKLGSHFEIDSGSYIHNSLSVWQQYGIFNYIIYSFIMIYPLIRLVCFYFKKEDKFLILPIMLSFYCLLMLVVSKSFIWSYAGLSVGSYLYVFNQYKFFNTNIVKVDFNEI